METMLLISSSLLSVSRTVELDTHTPQVLLGRHPQRISIGDCRSEISLAFLEYLLNLILWTELILD